VSAVWSEVTKADATNLASLGRDMATILVVESMLWLLPRGTWLVVVVHPATNLSTLVAGKHDEALPGFKGVESHVSSP
jgi:hypothetical protein